MSIRITIPPFSSRFNWIYAARGRGRQKQLEGNYTFDDAAPFLLVAVIDTGCPPLPGAGGACVLRRTVHDRTVVSTWIVVVAGVPSTLRSGASTEISEGLTCVSTSHDVATARRGAI